MKPYIAYMDTKRFRDVYLVAEEDDDILNTQYIIISTKIKKRGDKKNIIIANAFLYPDASVMMETDKVSMKEAYFDQLENHALSFLGSLIRGTLEENFRIVFMSTRKEYKMMPYLKWLSEFVWRVFKYPIMEYGDIFLGEKVKFNKQKVLKLTKKIMEEDREIEFRRNLQTVGGRERIKHQITLMTKKQLKQEMKRFSFNPKNCTKKEMKEILIDQL